MGRDHTWGSWTAHTCPICGKSGLKGKGGWVAHMRTQHPDWYTHYLWASLGASQWVRQDLRDLVYAHMREAWLRRAA